MLFNWFPVLYCTVLTACPLPICNWNEFGSGDANVMLRSDKESERRVVVSSVWMVIVRFTMPPSPTFILLLFEFVYFTYNPGCVLVSTYTDRPAQWAEFSWKSCPDTEAVMSRISWISSLELGSIPSGLVTLKVPTAGCVHLRTPFVTQGCALCKQTSPQALKN